MREYYARIVRSQREPYDRDVLWLRTLYSDRTDVGLFYWAIDRWKMYGTPLTNEDMEKLSAIILDGDGTKFLSDDGTYKEVTVPIPIEVIDNLESTSTNDALSANMGRELNEYIGEVENIAREVYNTINTSGTGDLYLSDNGTYTDPFDKLSVGNGLEKTTQPDDTNVSIKISDSDQLLVTDVAGIKADLKVTVNGNDIKILGKPDENGDPIIIAEINVLQSQIVENVEVIDGILYITFIVDGDPGTETVPIDLSEFIDVYEGSEYINITSNIISLDLVALKDELINTTLTSYLPLSGGTLTGTLISNGTILPNSAGISNLGATTNVWNNVVGRNYTGNTFTPTLNSLNSRVGSVTRPFISGYFSSLYKNGVSVATIDDLPDMDQYVNLTSSQSIGGTKVFTGQIILNNTTIAPQAAGTGGVGTTTYPFGTGYFNNLYKGGEEVATLDDIPSLTNYVTLNGVQTITGGKTFSGNVNIQQASIVPVTTGTSNIGSSALRFNSSYINTMYTNSLITTDTGGTYNVGSPSRPWTNGYFTNLYQNGNQVATVNSIPTDYVTLNTNQTIGGIKTFTSNLNVGSNTNATLNFVRAGSNFITSSEEGSSLNFITGGVSLSDISRAIVIDNNRNLYPGANLTTVSLGTSGNPWPSSYVNNFYVNSIVAKQTTSNVGSVANPFLNGYFTTLNTTNLNVGTSSNGTLNLVGNTNNYITSSSRNLQLRAYDSNNALVGLTMNSNIYGFYPASSSQPWTLGASSIPWTTGYINSLITQGITVNTGDIIMSKPSGTGFSSIRPNVDSVVDVGRTDIPFRNTYSTRLYVGDIVRNNVDYTGNNDIGTSTSRFGTAYLETINSNNITLSGQDKTSVLTTLTSTGDGTQFLANDGTYKDPVKLPYIGTITAIPAVAGGTGTNTYNIPLNGTDSVTIVVVRENMGDVPTATVSLNVGTSGKLYYKITTDGEAFQSFYDEHDLDNTPYEVDLGTEGGQIEFFNVVSMGVGTARTKYKIVLSRIPPSQGPTTIGDDIMLEITTEVGQAIPSSS